MDRFWNGLNHNIQDILMHKEYYYVNLMFLLACKAEQEIERRVLKATKSKKMVNFWAAPPTMIKVTRQCDEPRPTVPTSSETDLQGKSKGTKICFST